MRRRLAMLALALVVALGLAYGWPAAQAPAKKILTVDDYTRWRSITGQEIPGDGTWPGFPLVVIWRNILRASGPPPTCSSRVQRRRASKVELPSPSPR
jgi:hypothetical protein